MKKKAELNELDIIVTKAKKLSQSADPKRKELGLKICESLKTHCENKKKVRSFFHYAALIAQYESEVQ